MEGSREITNAKAHSGRSDDVRYWAPELIERNDGSATTESDTFSFAMMILECITEEQPFSRISRNAAVIYARLTQRENPPRPGGQDLRKRIDSDDLWNLMTGCWSYEPDRRPTMGDVHSFFQTRV